MAVQLDLCGTWSETPKDRFSYDAAPIIERGNIVSVCFVSVSMDTRHGAVHSGGYGEKR